MEDTAAAVKGLADGESGSLKAVLDELQTLVGTYPGTLHADSVAGAAAATNIAIAGIKTTDTLVAVFRFDVAADTGTAATGNKVQAVSKLGDVSVTSNGNIQSAGVDTTGDTLIVVWVALP